MLFACPRSCERPAYTFATRKSQVLPWNSIPRSLASAALLSIADPAPSPVHPLLRAGRGLRASTSLCDHAPTWFLYGQGSSVQRWPRVDAHGMLLACVGPGYRPLLHPTIGHCHMEGGLGVCIAPTLQARAYLFPSLYSAHRCDRTASCRRALKSRISSSCSSSRSRLSSCRISLIVSCCVDGGAYPAANLAARFASQYRCPSLPCTWES